MTTRQAYMCSTLPRLGYTYERAMSTPHLVIALNHMAHAKHIRRQASDTVYCSCGKQWDVRDEAPEGCK